MTKFHVLLHKTMSKILWFLVMTINIHKIKDNLHKYSGKDSFKDNLLLSIYQ